MYANIMALLVALGTSAAALPAMAQTALPDHAAVAPGTDVTIEAIRLAYLEGRDKETVLLADRLLAAIAGSDDGAASVGETYFWRGAALRRLTRFDEALVALDAALRHGFRSPELHLERALSHRALGQEQEAEKEYQEAERLLPPDPERRARFSQRWLREWKEEPRFQLWLSPQIGYDTNVIGLDKDTVLVQGDQERESFYYGLGLTGRYYLVKKEDQLLSLDLRSALRAYSEEKEFNYLDNSVGATGRYPLWSIADFELRAALGEAYMQEDGHLRTTRTIAPALLLDLPFDWQTRVWADWTDADYYWDTVRDEYDYDGEIRRAGIGFGIGLGGGWSLGPSVNIAEYDTEGTDYRHSSWTLSLGLTSAQYLGCVFTPGVSYTRADYDEENSVTNFTEKREDRIWTYSLTVTIRALESLIRYAPTVSVAFTDHGSNIDPYDYDRWEPRFEVGILALSF